MIEGWLFEIRSERLAIGERVKMGIYRPCVKTIPCSTISHSLQEATGIMGINATGYLAEEKEGKAANALERLTITARDAATNNVRVPITIEFLSNVCAHILVLKSPALRSPDEMMARLPNGRFIMGGLRSKGFGGCTISLLRHVEREDAEIVVGILKTRIYEDWCGTFEIQPLRERYGYLYRPDPSDPYGKSGAYHRSLFEGSIVKAPRILCSLNEEKHYD